MQVSPQTAQPEASRAFTIILERLYTMARQTDASLGNPSDLETTLIALPSESAVRSCWCWKASRAVPAREPIRNSLTQPGWFGTLPAGSGSIPAPTRRRWFWRGMLNQEAVGCRTVEGAIRSLLAAGGSPDVGG